MSALLFSLSSALLLSPPVLVPIHVADVCVCSCTPACIFSLYIYCLCLFVSFACCVFSPIVSATAAAASPNHCRLAYSPVDSLCPGVTLPHCRSRCCCSQTGTSVFDFSRAPSVSQNAAQNAHTSFFFPLPPAPSAAQL